MSVTITVIAVLPAASAACPAVLAAATAAASTLGFAIGSTKAKVKAATKVDIAMEKSQAVSAGIAVGETVVFSKDDIQVKFYRDHQGKYGICVEGQYSQEQLREIGQQLADKITQQYVYNQLVTELQNRNYQVIDQQTRQDGTVTMHVRTFQG